MSIYRDRLNPRQWKFPLADPTARIALEERLSAVGTKRALITYSQLVEGITFRLPTVNEGMPFQIDTSDWRELDRAILGEFLGAISSASFQSHGFFASVLAVNKEERRPSPQFFTWMRDLGLIKARGEDAEIEFWVGEVAKAYDWYAGESGGNTGTSEHVT